MTEYLYGRYNDEYDEGKGNDDFEICDKVVIDSELRECEKGASVIHSMLYYAGREATIIEKHGTHYLLDVDKGQYRWNDYMLLSSEQAISPDPDIFQRLLL